MRNECMSWLWFISSEFVCFLLTSLGFFIYWWTIKYAFIYFFILVVLSIATLITNTIILRQPLTVMDRQEIRSDIIFRFYNMGFNYFLGVILAMAQFSFWNWRDNKFWIEFVVNLFMNIKLKKMTRYLMYIFGILLIAINKVSEYTILNYVDSSFWISS